MRLISLRSTSFLSIFFRRLNTFCNRFSACNASSYVGLMVLLLFVFSAPELMGQSKKPATTVKSSASKAIEEEELLEKSKRDAVLSEQEIKELRKRLERVKGDEDGVFPWDTIEGLVPKTNRFGNALFTNRKMSFAPRLDIAAPRNYMVGPGDEFRVAVYGVQEFDLDVRVSSSGMLHIPYAGSISAAGETLENLENRIRQKLIQNGFQSLRSGTSNLSVTVTQFRSITVTVVGAFQSGNYIVPAVATAFHALHLAGGPGTIGSYRAIKLVRDNKVEAIIDLYDFMINGNQSANIPLRDNDVLVIPVAELDVEVEGGVKRPLVFELLEQETLEDLLRYAGGYSANAHRASVDVRRYGNGGVFVTSYSTADFGNYSPQSGDVVVVKTVRKAARNAVYTSGAVERSGTYGYVDGMTLKDLLHISGGVRESALLTHGVVYRYRNNHQSAYLNFVPKDVVQGNSDIPLQEGDSIVIADEKAMFPRRYVEVRGQVRKPGRFYFAEGMTVRDALLLSGGLTRKAVDTVVEVYRQSVTPQGIGLQTIINVPINSKLEAFGDETALQVNDLLVVRYDKQKRPPYTVYLEGEVTNKGPYMLLDYEERLSSVLRRAGGITPLGNPNGVFVVRNEFGGYVEEKDFNRYNDLAVLKYNAYINQRNQILRIGKKQNSPQPNQQGSKDDDEFDDRIPGVIDSISIISVLNVKKLLSDVEVNIENDIILRDGDRIIVQYINNTIRVKGEVNNEVVLSYATKDLRVYLDNAGGLTESADKKRIFVIEPSGRSRKSRRFFWNTHYPEVQPGSIVVVPSKLEKIDGKVDPAKLAAAASISSSTLGVLFLIYSIVR